MKTTQNVAKVSAQLIRASLDDLKFHTDSDERTLSAIGVISAVAHALEMYAGGFEPTSTTEAGKAV